MLLDNLLLPCFLDLFLFLWGWVWFGLVFFFFFCMSHPPQRPNQKSSCKVSLAAHGLGLRSPCGGMPTDARAC